MRKSGIFLRAFENPTQAVNHHKEREFNYEHNINILKMIIKPVILSAEQGLALPGHRDHEKPACDDDNDNMMKVHQGNFLEIINRFAKLDTSLKDYYRARIS